MALTEEGSACWSAEHGENRGSFTPEEEEQEKEEEENEEGEEDEGGSGTEGDKVLMMQLCRCIASSSPLTSCRVVEKHKSVPEGSGRGQSQAIGLKDSLERKGGGGGGGEKGGRERGKAGR